MRMQNRIAFFFIHIILLYLFLLGCWCSSAGPSDLTSISSIQRSRLSSAFFVVPSERRRAANCLPRCTMGGGRWRGRRKWNERCPKLLSIQLFEPPRFLRVRLRVQEDFKVVGGGGAESVRLPLFRAAFVAIYPSIIFSPPHLVGNGKKKKNEMKYWNISGIPAKCQSAVESLRRTLSSRRWRRGEEKEWRSVLIEELFSWLWRCKQKKKTPSTDLFIRKQLRR